MKKIYSLFILSILALTMFVGCQMNPEDVKDVLNATYRVNVESSYEVSVNNATPKAGDKVVLTIKVPDGFSADDLKLSVMKGKTTIEFDNEESTENNKVKKSFTMPESDVEVTVNFEKKATPALTDDTDNEDDPQIETPTEGEDDNGDGEEDPVDEDEVTYGFVKTVDYTLVANGQSLPGTKTGAELIAIAKEKNLVKDTDYTIDGTTVTLTASGVGKYLGYSLSVNASGLYAITGGGMKEAGKTVTLSITHYDENETDWVTPKAEELYLVKVHIKEGETELTDIPVTVTKDHKITFTMPEKNINVFAEFCDIRYQFWEVGLDYKVCITSESQVNAVICFNSKAYDNLEPVDGKYVLKLGELNGSNGMCFNETKYGDYELSYDGTLNDNQYTFGVIDNSVLKILEMSDKLFYYNPNATHIN